MLKHLRPILATAAAAVLTGGLLTAAASPSVAVDGVEGDFNNDGYGDVVAAAGYAHVNGKAGAGQIVVYWGGPDGLDPARRSPISQASPGVPGSPEEGDLFGNSLRTGDFNGDGISDLLVSAYLEDLGGDEEAGMLSVLWGSSEGLVSGAVIGDPDGSGHDRFGQSLAVGDFDADGTTDIAVGTDHPTVHILAGGLDTWGEPAFDYTVRPNLAPGFNGAFYLTAGQVEGEGTGDDLVVNGLENEPDENGYIYNANFYFPGIAGKGLAGDGEPLQGGIVTDIGDTDGDGFGDLVIGTEWDQGVPGSTKGGKVTVLYGTADGPNGRVVTVTQNTSGVVGASENDDRFGDTLHLGDVNGDGFEDLVIGSSEENLGDAYDTGAVHLLYGSPAGITTTGAQYFNQNTPGVPGSNEKQDYFGSDVLLRDVDADGDDDLAIGAMGENWFNGSVTALRSDGTRIVTDGALWMSARSSGVPTAGQPGLGGRFKG
ncbi:FG-GAP and VCBS repeat-containing protein [Streptomyces sp. TR06-5]|uniref:FG-GAP and VCBS repeat-containing protein n=1 Tax=unclassified Streptomyces TaxID=2593676 RepID=UPI0039A17007